MKNTVSRTEIIDLAINFPLKHSHLNEIGQKYIIHEKQEKEQQEKRRQEREKRRIQKMGQFF